MADYVLRFNTKLGQLDLEDTPMLNFVLGCPESLRPELLAVSRSGEEGLRLVQNRAIMLASLKTVATTSGGAPQDVVQLDVKSRHSRLRGRCFKCNEVGHKGKDCPNVDKKRWREVVHLLVCLGLEHCFGLRL